MASALLLLALGAGCREHPAPAAVPARDPAQLDPNARFDDFVKQYLDGFTAFRPATATWLGLHGADDKLDEASAAAFAREAQRLRRSLDRVEAFRADTLDANRQLDRLLLDRHARVALFELGELRPQERNPAHYIDVLTSSLYDLLARDFAPLTDRLRAVNGRLFRARFLFDEARRNLRNPPELLTRRAFDLGTNARGFIAETLPRVVGAVGDDRLLAEFRAAQGEALRALDDYLGFLQRDLQPRSKGDLPIGKARLAEWLRQREMVELPPEVLLAQLLATGERELKAASRRFDEASRQAFPGRSVGDAYRTLEDDRPAPDQLLPAVGATVEQLRAFARERDLVTLPRAAPRVMEMPPYLWGFLHVTLPGPFEPQPRDELYVDPVNRAWDKKTTEEHVRAFNRAQLVQALAREAIAHVAQAEAARSAPTTMQKLSVDGAFAEGWPRYFAQQVIEEGFGAEADHPDPRLRLAQRREALLALGRFVAALRFHAQLARLDDVVNLFASQCYLEDPVARREAERVAADPEVLDEGLGYLALLKLRDDVQRERGDAFSAGRFHDELLAHGQLPLGLLRRRLLRDPDPDLL